MLDRREKDILERLLRITKNCREDMHEPDEQGISAIVSGYHLDNAMGSNPHNNCGELTVGLKDAGEHDDETCDQLWFNLADLIALARQAR